jgi:hypothetical protein
LPISFSIAAPVLQATEESFFGTSNQFFFSSSMALSLITISKLLDVLVLL